MRHTTKQGGMEVLSLKYFDNIVEGGSYKYKNYNVKKDGDQFYFSREHKNRFFMPS